MSQLTPLEQKLREIAILNWDQFAKLIGEKAILDAKICLLRQSGKSWAEICNKLDVLPNKARYACKNCDND